MKLLEPNWQELDLQDLEYTQNLHPIFDTVLDTYHNVKDPHVKGHITLWDALQKIRYNLGQDINPQMYLTPKYVNNVKNTVYDELKEKLPAICYNASFNGYKNLKNTKAIHNLMFLDIDNFSSREEALAYKAEIINKYDWILACSLSLSKIGLHVIVMVDSITDSNDYNRKYEYISTTYFNNGLDNDSKSLSRFTIVPYDYDIYISDNPVTLPIDSIIQKSMSSTYIKSLAHQDKGKSMGSTYIPNPTASSNALSESVSESMSSTYIPSSINSDIAFNGNESKSMGSAYIPDSQHDNEKSMSCCMGREGICTTHTFSELQKLNEFLNKSAREKGLVFKSFANEDLIEDPDMPLFNYNGFPVVEINLFIYGKQSVTEGHRTSFLGAILAQMIYLNVMLPDKHHPDVRKNLLGFMKSVNRKYCYPVLPDNELLRSYNTHWKRYHEGSLDVSKYVKSKRSLWSVKCSLTSNQKKSKTMTEINKYKRGNNLVILHEILQDMVDNGEIITQDKVIDEIKTREIKGLGITTVKNLWKHFKPSIQAYKKGLSNNIELDVTVTKTEKKVKKSELAELDFDDVLDLGADVLENQWNIVFTDSDDKPTENISLSDEQQRLIFNRIYSNILREFEAQEQTQLYELFQKELNEFKSNEKRIILMDATSIDDDNFWIHSSLESRLLNLCNKIKLKI